MNELALGKIVRRSLLYVGLALAALAVIGLLIAVSVRTGIALTGGTIGLVVYTSGLFWITVSKSREYWHLPTFWLAVSGLLVVHLLAFAAVLHSYPQWRMIWFMPIVIAEAVLFSTILDRLISTRK